VSLSFAFWCASRDHPRKFLPVLHRSRHRRRFACPSQGRSCPARLTKPAIDDLRKAQTVSGSSALFTRLVRPLPSSSIIIIFFFFLFFLQRILSPFLTGLRSIYISSVIIRFPPSFRPISFCCGIPWCCLEVCRLSVYAAVNSNTDPLRSLAHDVTYLT